jgi:uncharacterized BrkB/YihY/UPF0761 family membrane protein
MLMLWVYYSVQVFFLGATFTAVRARAHGGGVKSPEPRTTVTSVAREPTAP